MELSSELVANDYDGAVMSNALAFEIYGGDGNVGGTFFDGKAITVLGTLNAKGVSLYDGYGGLYTLLLQQEAYWKTSNGDNYQAKLEI